MHTMKKRIQVSINPVLVQRAKKLMDARGFDSFSEFLEDLIRQEMDRRKDSTVGHFHSLDDAPGNGPAPPAKNPARAR